MSVKFNPFTGTFDLIGSASASVDNFSYNVIASGVTVTIPLNQQMTVVGGNLELVGTLNIIGELAVVT